MHMHGLSNVSGVMNEMSLSNDHEIINRNCGEKLFDVMLCDLVKYCMQGV